MRTITVKGVGSISAKPDYIMLSLNIDSTDKEYEKALQKATERIHLLQKMAQQNNFDDGSLKTTSFRVTTEYENVKERSGNYRREFAGYCCSYRLKLAFDFDNLRLMKVLSSISASDAKPELSIAFTVKDPSQVNEALLENAALNAKKKAEVLCRSSGVKLGELLGIDYNWDLDIAAIRCDSQMASSERMYPLIGYLEAGFRPNMRLVVTDDVSALLTSLGSSMMAGQEMARTWVQKYGDEINCIFSYGDNGAMGAAEVVKANGDPNGEKCFVVGIDGGKQSWSYIRDDSPLKYSYAQPMELFAHQMAELVEQIQIQGLNPGDAGCLLDKAGNALYTEGSIVTKDNVPDVGTSIHCAFDYYDETITGEDAWWNWTDGPGIYMVEAYEG